MHYFLRDHLGSVRAKVNESGEAIERNDYYPFGSHRTVAGSGATPNRFKYNGKELQTTGELGFLDYGARMYDAELGRWFNTDSLAEKYYSLSSYNYCGNNPLVFVDPNGIDYWTTSAPAMIALFLNTLRGTNDNRLESIDYSGWAHYTDAEVISLLMLNDKTKKFVLWSGD